MRHDVRGSGPPVLLVHGLGSRRRVWGPVADDLARDHTVVAVDLPGFGESPPLPPGVEPSPAALAEAVAGLLDRLGLRDPYVVGHSLGGFVAFELAKRGRARSVCALMPAGLWAGRAPLHTTLSLRVAHAAARAARPALPLLRYGPVRRVAMAAMARHPDRLDPEDAVGDARAYADAPGFSATLRSTNSSPLLGGADIRVPVTVVLGAHDLLIRPADVRRDRLPAHTRWLVLDRCGHTPMFDAPGRTVRIVREALAQPVGQPAQPSAATAAGEA